jgi:arginine repressor
VVKQLGKLARQDRSDKKQVDVILLERLYQECDGWVQRIHEKLVEEEGIQVGYSTLTRMLRELGLRRIPS